MTPEDHDASRENENRDCCTPKKHLPFLVQSGHYRSLSKMLLNEDGPDRLWGVEALGPGPALRVRRFVRWRSPAPPVMPPVPPMPAVAPPDLLRRLGRRGSLADGDAIGWYRRSRGNTKQSDCSRCGGGKGDHSQSHCTLLFALMVTNSMTARVASMFDAFTSPWEE
jgi:hypothetical protein